MQVQLFEILFKCLYIRTHVNATVHYCQFSNYKNIPDECSVLITLECPHWFRFKYTSTRDTTINTTMTSETVMGTTSETD